MYLYIYMYIFMYLYIYIKLIHFAVYLKLTDCKSVIQQ